MSTCGYKLILLGIIVTFSSWETVVTAQGEKVMPGPDPKHPPKTTYKPRLGDSVTLTIQAVGHPQFFWTHNGKSIKSRDRDEESEITLESVDVDDFGDYMLLMTNSEGNYTLVYSLLAEGPPEPVSNINVANVSIYSANITFVTGYNYNDSQTFIITDKNSNLSSCKDLTSGRGMQPFACVLYNLTEDTIYNITVISCNSRGEAKPNSEFVVFSTYGVPKPDPTINGTYMFTPRIPEAVTMTIHAVGYPPPKFEWWHDGKSLNSSDTNCTSYLTVKILDGKDFGKYVLNMTNKVGNSSVVYQVLAEGPPEPVSDIKVTNISINSADITFTTGYDYNDTQTFIIKNKSSNLTSCEDTTSGKGRDPFACALYNLTEDTIYNITVISSNSRGESKPNSEFVAFSTYGIPKPDPRINDTYIFTPRIPDDVTMTIHAVGNPPPKFEWWHDGKSLNGSDTNYTSSLTVKILDGKDFGKYVLNMMNKVGNSSMVYQVLADGPPEPVSDIKVANISINSADITFTTGYDYNNSQTFIIINKNSSDLSSCEDTTSGKGRDPFACALYNLTEDTIYNITVISSNSRGESKPSSEFVAFSTYGVPKPDPAINGTYIFSPRIPDDVTMTIHAVGNPPPKFDWWHDGKSLNSSDANYTSSLTVKILDGKDFGKYVLNMTNKVGNSSMVYQVLAEGPPDAVSNLNVTNVTETSANITFTSGYDYNDTQTFVVLNNTNGNATKLTSVKGATHDDGGTAVIIYLDKLKPVSNYNITVVSINSRGESTPVDAYLQFETLGKPAPDPSYKDNVTATPRLGSNITLMFHAVGNPLPSFQWYHDNKPLGNSSTGHMTSLTLKNFIVSSFGTYLLNMRNYLGETNVTFNVTANGPPDPVRDLVAGEVTSDSVQLYWRPGFNYGSDQTFTIYQVGNEKELQGKIEDTTKGNFSMNETYKLTGLSDSTTYTVYLMAINEHGKASQYSNSVNFTTSDSDDGGTTAEIVGYVVGGIGFVVLILVIISLIRCYMARRGNLYENLQEEEPQHSGFDDAGAS